MELKSIAPLAQAMKENIGQLLIGKDEQLELVLIGLFAGGQLSEDALEGAMRALNDAYWMAKEKNKKFTPKKYRQQEE